DPRGFMIGQFRNLPTDDRHPILYPYMELLPELGSIDELLELAARSGVWIRGDGPSTVDDIVPPMVLVNGGRGTFMGMARRWTKDERFFYLDMTAMIGAVQRLLSDRPPYRPCPHTACPVHRTALCHAWFAVPRQIGWSECAFPIRLQTQFKQGADQLI